LGVVYHFDLPVYLPGGWTATRKTLDPRLYNPARLDTDQWLELARAMGARYAIFTATHFNGFLQWQSDVYPYGLKQAAWRGGKGDLVADFVESCRRCGIEPGIYLSCHRNAYWNVWGHRVNWGKGGDRQADFARIGERMTEELCSRYGPLVELWYDAGLLHPKDGGPDVLPVVERHQPDVVFYHSPQRRDHRWIGNESGVAGDPCWATMPDLDSAEKAHHRRIPNARELLFHGDPNGTLWSPAMCDPPMREHDWFWRPDSEHKLHSLESLIAMYYQSVGRNANLIVGAVPNCQGLIDEPDLRRAAEFGREIRRRFDTPLAETAGEGASLDLVLPKPGQVDHVTIMEDIARGERVRAYRVEGQTGGEAWKTLCEGTSVGHKRIERFSRVEVAAVRFIATESVGTPAIRKLAVYDTA
jgi:alpha-L-fucosidase